MFKIKLEIMKKVIINGNNKVSISGKEMEKLSKYLIDLFGEENLSITNFEINCKQGLKVVYKD